MSGRPVAGIALVTGLAAVAGIFVALRPEPTLADQARELHEVEPYALEGLTLESWTRSGTVLRATYEGSGVVARFDLRLWADEGAAQEWLRRRAEALTGAETLDVAAVEGREPCGDTGAGTTCVGRDGHRTFEAAVTRAGNGEVDPRLLLRIARKHWYRVMGGASP